MHLIIYIVRDLHRREKGDARARARSLIPLHGREFRDGDAFLAVLPEILATAKQEMRSLRGAYGNDLARPRKARLVARTPTLFSRGTLRWVRTSPGRSRSHLLGSDFSSAPSSNRGGARVRRHASDAPVPKRSRGLALFLLLSIPFPSASSTVNLKPVRCAADIASRAENAIIEIESTLARSGVFAPPFPPAYSHLRAAKEADCVRAVKWNFFFFFFKENALPDRIDRG